MIATPKETRRFSMSSVETMGVIEPRRCGQCFKMFQPQKYGQIYCSYRCRDYISQCCKMVDRGWEHFWAHEERPDAPPMDQVIRWSDEDLTWLLGGGACGSQWSSKRGSAVDHQAKFWSSK